MDYGMRRAAQRAKERDSRPVRTKKRKVVTRVFEGELSTYPLKGKTFGIDENVDWDDSATNEIAEGLYKRFQELPSRLQILKLGTGKSKTAAAVACLGFMQERSGETLRHVVTAKAQLIQAEAWQKTFETYNVSHEIPLSPYLIESTDGFASKLSNEDIARDLNEYLAGGMVVLDEIHKYKNPTKKRAQTLKRLKTPRYLGLSGTVLTNRPVDDIISYLVIAGYYKSKNHFVKTYELERWYDRFNNLDVYLKNGRVDLAKFPAFPKILDELSTVIYRPNVEIPGMPNADLIPIHLPESEELISNILSLQVAYEKGALEFASDLRAELERAIYTDRLRIETIVDDATAKGVMQPLVFFQNKYCRDALVKELRFRGCDFQILEGRVSVADIDREADTPILIQYQSGGDSLGFTKSNTALLAQNQPSYLMRKQALGRPVRRGMKHNVRIREYISPCDFDEELYERVAVGMEEVSEEILDAIAVTAVKR